MINGSLCSRLCCKQMSECGSEINPNQVGSENNINNLGFGNNTNNLVYMDKVFDIEEESACPIKLILNGGELILDSTSVSSPISNSRCQNSCTCGCNCCGCNCCGCPQEITPATTFKVDNAYVMIKAANLCPSSSFSSDDVTLDGIPVDSLNLENGRYTASIDQIMDSLVKCKCIRNGLPTSTFFLAEAAGPWKVDLTIEIEGTMVNGGTTCCFKQCYSTPNNRPITLNDDSKFAISPLNIPCSVNGDSPTLVFSFDGEGALLNPSVRVVNGEQNFPILMGTLIFEPTIEIKVVRPTLFRINAAESISCCDEATTCCHCEEEIECSHDDNDRECNRNNRPDNRTVSGAQQANNSCCQNRCCQYNGSNGYSW